MTRAYLGFCFLLKMFSCEETQFPCQAVARFQGRVYHAYIIFLQEATGVEGMALANNINDAKIKPP